MSLSATDSVMTVVRVRTDEWGSSHIEPPLRDEWDDATKLRWHAAVFTADTCVPVLVHEMERHGRPIYSIQLGRSSHGAVPFHEAWHFLSVASCGAQAALDLYEPGPDAARWTPDTEETTP